MSRSRAALVAAGLLAAASCYEPPVSERVEIEFVGGSGAKVRTLVRLRAASDLKGGSRERVAQAARAISQESDAWAVRVRDAEPVDDRFEVVRRRGEIVEAVRTAFLEQRTAVEIFFRGTPVGARYAEGPDWQEFTLVADPAGPASAQERRKTDERIERWAEDAAAYFEAATALWAFVERHPDRARPCFETLFVRGGPAGPDAGDEEAALIRALEEGMGSVLGVLLADEDDAFTFSERVGRAYDPFPAPVTVRVPGEPIESEGFTAAPDGVFAVEALDLWNAFRSLEGRWLAPDPAVATWKHDVAAEKGPFDVDAFVTLPRFAAPPPCASEIVSALRTALRPARVYRVRWRPPAGGADRGDEGR